jgi:hypothetical protein
MDSGLADPISGSPEIGNLRRRKSGRPDLRAPAPRNDSGDLGEHKQLTRAASYSRLHHSREIPDKGLRNRWAGLSASAEILRT